MFFLLNLSSDYFSLVTFRGTALVSGSVEVETFSVLEKVRVSTNGLTASIWLWVESSCIWFASVIFKIKYPVTQKLAAKSRMTALA